MKKIIFDTNFLLIPVQFKVDVFSEVDRICNFNYQLCILDKSINELENIVKSQKGKSKRAAKIALQLIKTKNIKIISTKNIEKNADDSIVEIANKTEHIVATLDKELKKRLKQKGISLISLRQKKYLILSQ